MCQHSHEIGLHLQLTNVGLPHLVVEPAQQILLADLARYIVQVQLLSVNLPIAHPFTLHIDLEGVDRFSDSEPGY